MGVVNWALYEREGAVFNLSWLVKHGVLRCERESMSAPPLIVAFVVMISIVFIVPSVLIKVGISNWLAISAITSAPCLLAMILSVVLR